MERERGEGKVVVGVRFTLVRLAPLDIPDIPTSGMLGAPPSSPCMSGAAVDSGGFYVAHTDGPFGRIRNRIRSNLGGHGNKQDGRRQAFLSYIRGWQLRSSDYRDVCQP